MLLLLVLTWSTACTVTLDEPAGRACDAEHPCLDDRVCVEGVCRAPGEGACATVPLGASCVVGLGVCATTGTWICTDGSPTCDATAGSPAPAEACDGLDNDCNGVVDDLPGCMVTLVGLNGPVGLTDGTGNAARVAMPGYLNADAAGNLFLADTGNHSIRHITPAGMVTTIAGTGRCGFVDGPVATARFCEPTEVVPGPDGALYVSDSGNHLIRRIHEGRVTTVAGTGEVGDRDGYALNSQFDYPMGLFLRADGSLLIADSGNAVIRRYIPGPLPLLQTIAGSGWGILEGSRDNVGFYGVADVVEDSAGTLYVSDLYASRLRMLPVVGDSSTIAGRLWNSGYREGGPSQIRMSEPTQLHLDEAGGILYFADRWNYLVRALPSDGPSYPVAGAGGYGYADGPLEVARAQYVMGFAKVGQDFFFSDGNHAVRKSSAGAGAIATSGFVAGSLHQRALDGPGSVARLAQPRSLVRAADGTMYWVDFTAHLVRKLTPSGEVVTLVGQPNAASEGRSIGDFARASVSLPAGLTFAPDGALYLTELGNCAVRKLDLAQRQLLHVAGATDGTCDHADGAPGVARFDGPRGLAFGRDASGQDVLYVGDTYNQLLKKIVLPDGPVTTIAGVPWIEGNGDGPLGDGLLSYPGPIAADLAGNVWVIQSGIIRHLSPSGVLSTPYSGLPVHAQSVILDGNVLVVTGEGAIARMQALPPDPDSVEVVFKAPFGWQDGFELEAGGGDFESIVATPEAYYVADFLTGQIRQLWR